MKKIKRWSEVYASYYLTDQTKVTADVFYENEDRTLWDSGIKEFNLQPSTMLDEYGIGLRIDHNSFSVKGFSTKHNLAASRINSRFNEESEYNFSYSSTSNKTINKNLLFNLPLSFDYFTSDEWFEDPNQFTARPNVFYKKNNVSIRGGAFLATNDSLYIRPHVEASYQITKYNIEVQASYVANSSINSLHKMYNEMPFFSNAQDSIASFARNEKISLGALYKTKQANLYLGGFYAIGFDIPQYYYQNLLHHNVTNDVKGFGLELKGNYALKKILTAFIDLELNGSKLWVGDQKSSFSPYYLPLFRLDLKLEQELFKNLVVYERMMYQSSRLALVGLDLLDEIPSFLDIGAGIEYLFKKKIGLYFEAGNLLNKSYNRYYRDPSFGLNFHGGIKFLF